MRIALKIIIALVVLVIAGLAALPFIIDPNDYKDEISSQVEKATGRNLSLQGDIKLSVFPWIALELGPLSLSNAKGFKAESFAEVKAAEIRIKLLPLLKKQLEMDTVVLDGLVLNLETAKDGKTNWDDLSGTASDSEPKQQDEPAEKSDTASPALAAVSIAGVQLTNANILWSDASQGTNYQLRNLNLNTDPLEPGEPTALDMDFDLISATPEAKAHVNLATQLMVDMENQRYALTDLKFNTIAQGKALPVNEADLSLSADITADMLSKVVAIPQLDLELKANNKEQSVEATISGAVNSNLGSQLTTVKDLNIKAKVKDPSLPMKEAELSVTTQLAADLNKQTLSVKDLLLQVQDLMLAANIEANSILSDKPAFSGDLHLKPFNLRKLAGDLNIELPEMADNSTLEMLELQTQLSGNTNAVSAKQLNVKLDQSTLTGDFAISNFAKPAFKFKLALDEIDADRYMPPVQQQQDNAKPAAATPGTAAAGSSDFPLEPLRQINAKGTLDIGKMKATGMRSENIHVTIDAADGLVKLSPMSADLYQGQYKGNVNLDARGDALKLSLDEKVINIQAEPLLNDMTGEAKISGVANANAKLTATGKNPDQIKQTLTGNGGFSFENGALKGINIGESIRKAKAALKGEKLAASDAAVQTDFSALSGTFTAKNGLIDNQDLALKSPLLRINGAGQASLPKETIDYSLKVAIVGSAEGQGGKELQDLKGLSIPVKITGTFAEPKPTVDLGSLLKDKAKQELKSKAEEKIKEKIGGDLGGLLGGALGADAANDESATQTEEAAQADETTTEEAPASAEDQLKGAVKDKLKSFF